MELSVVGSMGYARCRAGTLKKPRSARCAAVRVQYSPAPDGLTAAVPLRKKATALLGAYTRSVLVVFAGKVFHRREKEKIHWKFASLPAEKYSTAWKRQSCAECFLFPRQRDISPGGKEKVAP